MAWDECASAESFLEKGVQDSIEKCVRELIKKLPKETFWDLKIISQAMVAIGKKFPNIIFELELVAIYNVSGLNSGRFKSGVDLSIHNYATRQVLARITIVRQILLIKGGPSGGGYPIGQD